MPPDFAAQVTPPWPFGKDAVLNHDVPAGNVDAQAILVAPGLDGDAIVAVAEGAVFDQHVGAGIRIATVGVRAGRLLTTVTPRMVTLVQYSGVITHIGELSNRDAVDQDILATTGWMKSGRR